MVPTVVVAAVAGALFVLWAALAAWIVAARVHDDRRRRRRERDRRLLQRGVDASRWSRRRLQRVADGEPAPGAADAARELVRREGGRLRRLARERTFRRTHALRVLTRARAPFVYGLLRGAVATGSADVRAAVVAIASEQETEEADGLLLDVLVAGDHPRSRTATELVPRVSRLMRDLLVLATHDEPEVRYWALMLLREAATDPRAKAAAVTAATDGEGTVRSAAARVLGASGAYDVQPALRALLADEVFFVRSHAARAAAEIHAEPLADDIAALLADRSWWVRAAAKESLLKLGPSGLRAASAMLGADDSFARDSAREVIAAFRLDAQQLERAG